jgi:hypothetical protein
LVPHNFEWDSLDDQGAVLNQTKFKKLLIETAVELKKKNGAFNTYQEFLEKE